MPKSTIIIATIKSWNIKNAHRLQNELKDEYNVNIITQKRFLKADIVKKINPKFIFLPHWSWMIDKEIYTHFTCICFHETDLPFGRGGTPIQNLILLGNNKTKITAFKVTDILDGGPIYLKKDLDLSGSIEDILRRSSDLIFTKMIPYILDQKPKSVPQEGSVKIFKRLIPSQSKIENDITLSKLYDKIRILDGEGYPKAFLETQKLKYYFFSVAKKRGQIESKVIIKEK